jgi:hypothetical protein
MAEIEPEKKYEIHVNVVAGAMATTLLLGAFVGAVFGGMTGLLLWLLMWGAYFLVAYMLLSLQLSQVAAYNEKLEESVNLDRSTSFFLFWPVTIFFTGIYIPLVLFLRRTFRSN